MGEDALYGGQRIKIGTCEDMYYLRADQLHLVTAIRPHNLDPRDREIQRHIRFRFPWPDEDGIPPGAFGDFDRGLGVSDVRPPEAVDHGTVQFVARRGYLVSLPCPESTEAITMAMRAGLTIHRNGHPGPVRIVQQRFWEGKLVTVCACGGCDARYRLETYEDAQPLVTELLKEEQQQPRGGGWHRKVAERIAAGYGVALPGGPG